MTQSKQSKAHPKKKRAVQPKATSVKSKAKPAARPNVPAKAAPKPAPLEKAKPEAKGKAVVPTKAAVPAKGAPPGKGAPPAKGTAPGKGAPPGKGATTAKGAAPGRPPRKSSRRPSLLRRGPDGEILAPGDLLLPGGAQRQEEVLYLFRGCSAAEHPAFDETLAEVLAKRADAPASERDELARGLAWARERFERGSIEPAIPPRPNVRRTFQGVLERAKQRRREIGAFLRGLDLGHTETSHMDAHGEASLVSLMKLAAGLENLAEAEEPPQTDATEFHRVFEQLEAATETLIIDVEQTLRRLRDRIKA
jgi:hypothetical protein